MKEFFKRLQICCFIFLVDWSCTVLMGWWDFSLGVLWRQSDANNSFQKINHRLSKPTPCKMSALKLTCRNPVGCLASLSKLPSIAIPECENCSRNIFAIILATLSHSFASSALRSIASRYFAFHLKAKWQVWMEGTCGSVWNCWF